MKKLVMFAWLMLALVGRCLAGESLLTNGDFLSEGTEGWPADWPRPEGTSWEKEGDVRFLRLRSAKPGQMILVYRQAILPSPTPQAVEVRFRLRYADIKPGAKPYFDGRVIFHFKDKDANILKPEPEPLAFHGSSDGWVERTVLLKVPRGSHLLEVMPSLFQAAQGTLDLARCEAFPATLPPSVRSTTIVPAHPERLPPELHVVGNRLQDPKGQEVWLQGLAVPSLEWSLTGEHVQESIQVGREQWHANVFRLPVSLESWFGEHHQKDRGVGYRQTVDAAVEAATSRGAYLALDLHSFGAPAEEHVEFWNDAAVRYRNHPAVLFDLFNEPHGISWKTWRDGGSLAGKDNAKADVNVAENTQSATGPAAVGMQALVDAVRATGARNVVIAGGLDWGYDLSGVTQGFALTDRAGGNGIMYSTHIYPWKHDWATKVLAAAGRYPIFVGEVGCTLTPMPFIPKQQHQDPYAWAPDVLGLIQRHKLHWTAWSFHPTAAPNVISDWKYTPTPYWGAPVKEALEGKTFELKRVR